MGIPNYFNTIVNQNPNIVKSIAKLENIENLYLDSNSIIYDCYNKIKDKYEPLQLTTFELELISNIIDKIEYYREIIKPKNKLGIFFDGPAPLCKLEQQRTRRHRVIFEKNLKERLNIKKKQEWNTTCITPGTEFMNQLNKTILNYYKNDNSVLISTSNDPGEGEHKIFNYIRDNKEYHNETISVIYGLDADLIMLSLNHLPITKKIYLSRETPHFSKDLNMDMNELMYLDIPKLSRHIINDMKNKGMYINKNTNYKTLLDDYILMCFLLGNDFLPHFPILSIRNNGIDILLNHYKNLFNKNNYTLTNDGKINWNNFRKFINSLALEEEKLFCETHKIREKQSNHIRIPVNKEEQKMTNLNYIPIKNREIENMINPFKHNWQYRYYKYLLDIEIDSTYRKKISLNYLQGIEWVFDYYTKNCVNWRWKYNYSYPPLLSDLINYIPCYNNRILPVTETKTIMPHVQLCYVLPRDCWDLIHRKYINKIKDKLNNCYTDDPYFKWSYCKYFWESHIELPDIDINKLEEILI